MFYKWIIDSKHNLFDELFKSCKFENVANGRLGAVLVDCKDNLIPLVRTTTDYKMPSQMFSQIHHDLINKIKAVANNYDLDFNNAMIEVYDSNYRTMGYHTDQSLDLADNSYICIFSCYNEQTDFDIRKLKIINKETWECLHKYTL